MHLALGRSAMLVIACAAVLAVAGGAQAAPAGPHRTATTLPTKRAIPSSCGWGRVHHWGRCVPKAQIFHPNRHNLSGLAAAKVLLPFLKNSTFTDCRARFPRCAVEHRYGHFSSGVMYYCRLTPTVGGDIINGARAFQIIGANVRTSGAWAVTLRVLSYGDQLVYYTWSVSNTGIARGLYWGPGLTPGTSAGEGLGGLRWVRGARNCSY